jgi:hypothetical protein
MKLQSGRRITFTITLLLTLLLVQRSLQLPLQDQSKADPTCDEECICHPPPASSKTQYVVGYGSLIKSSSVRKTDPHAGDIIPVIVDGYQRAWNAQGQGISLGTTYLGVEQRENSSFNGVVFPLPQPTQEKNASALIKNYDLRESWYCRHRLPLEKIKFLDGGAPKEGEYWIWINKPEFTVRPNKKYPIVQSYVDIFIAGCMEVEEGFNLPGYTSACIKSTEGWNKYWVNDRIYPRRPQILEPRAPSIDRILAEELPQAFREIKIEG